MSRIGNKLITIPAGVTVEVAAGNEVTVKGPKGTLTRKFSDLMEIKVEENQVTVVRQMTKNTQNSYMVQLVLCYITW